MLTFHLTLSRAQQQLESQQTFQDTRNEDITSQENYMTNLGKFNAEVKQVEDEFRKLFLERKPQEFASSIGNSLLIDVFSERETFREEDIKNFEGWKGDLLMHRERYHRYGSKPAPSNALTVVDRENFLKNFSMVTQNVFDGVDWSNMFIAGGSILAALTATDNKIPASFHNTDIDVFIYGLSPEAASKKILAVCEQINKNSKGGGHILVSQHSVTLLGLYPTRHIQFVLRLYR